MRAHEACRCWETPSEIGMGVSCRNSGETGRRAELELRSSKSLENHHGTATFGTDPKRFRFLGGRWLLFYLRWRGGVEELKAKRQESGAAAVGEEAELADADQAGGQHVQQEAAQELSSARVISLCSLL